GQRPTAAAFIAAACHAPGRGTSRACAFIYWGRGLAPAAGRRPAAPGPQVRAGGGGGHRSMDRQAGFGLWLGGGPGAGKSPAAGGRAGEVRAGGRGVEVLDGDEVRRVLSQGLGFSRADRDANVMRIAYVAKLLARHGVIVIVAAISPYREARERARQEIGRFVEVYVRCPLEVCVERGVKGL